MGSTEATGIFSAPVWWDPRARKVIFDKKSVIPGVLVAAGDNLSFVGPTEIVFDLLRADTEIEFLQLTSGFEVRTGDSRYRVFLRPPVNGVPLLDRDAVLAIGLGLTRTATVTDWTAARLHKPVDAVTSHELGEVAADILGIVAADVAGALGKDRCTALRAMWATSGS
ncbi:MAG TPA: hypothetical protein VFX16_16635 [Pseudonocardiaceae bacterium]|nr:hypothetical protein [Pseudonocardiaceae bacterium]